MLAEQDGLVVIGASENGRQALEQIPALNPTVALIDIGMPGRDGVEVTHGLHQIRLCLSQ